MIGSETEDDFAENSVQDSPYRQGLHDNWKKFNIAYALRMCTSRYKFDCYPVRKSIATIRYRGVCQCKTYIIVHE